MGAYEKAKNILKSILTVGILSFFSISFQACTSGSSKSVDKNNQTVALPVQVVDTATAVTEKTYLGTIEGKVNVEIRPQIEGILEEIYVDEGAYVEKGQKLFKINPQTYQEELNNALANENVEKANLENARLEVDRLKPLVENEVISEVRLRSAMSDYEVAKASLAQASAAVATARINLGFTTIKAPVSGYIGRIPKRIGNLVNDSEPLTTLSDIEEVYVYFAMSESDFLYFSSKKKQDSTDITESSNLVPYVSLIMANGEEYPFQGKVDAVDGQVDRTTGAISLRAIFPNEDNLLRSGNRGTLKMQERKTGVILVPQVATSELQDKIFVHVLQPDNRVKRQEIKVAGTSASNYIVSDGLQVGDRIILSGFDKLSDQVKVNPIVKSASRI